MDETRRISQQKTGRLKSQPTTPIGSGQPVQMQPSLGQLPMNTVIADRYEVAGEISTHGGEADVFICRDLQTSQQVAVKIYRANLQPNQDLLNILLELDHKHIVKLIDFGVWNGRSFEVMKYAEGGTLEDHMPYEENELMHTIIPQILSAIHYLHENKIIHKDLKPTNLFFSNKERKAVLVGDYGISSLVIGPQSLHYSTPAKRTVQFTAPERFSGYFGYEVDYYALGITLVWFFKGKDPFEGISEAQIIYSHLAPEEHNFIPVNCSDHLRTLIRGLLHKNRKHRWGYDEIGRWLNGEAVPVVEYMTAQTQHTFSYKLGQNLIAHSPEDLAKMMIDNPELAKQHIRRPPFFETFNLYDQALASKLHDVRERASSIEEAFIEIVYTLNPELPYKLTDDCQASNPQELARFIDRDRLTWAAGKEQLYNGSILAWLRATGYEDIANEWNKVADKYHSDK